MAELQQDVVIVGAGPTGLTLAAELWRLGLHPLLLERETSRPITRARDCDPCADVGGSGGA